MQTPKQKCGAILALLFLALGVTLSGTASATSSSAPPKPRPVAGKQAKPPTVKKATAQASKGATKRVVTDAKGRLVKSADKVKAAAGNVAGVDFSSQLNYCQQGLTYTPVKNVTGSTKYIHVQLYANGSYRDFYTSVAAGGTAYPYFYGVSGTTYAYLYVWNGSSYVYDEYLGGANNCSVSATLTNTVYTGYKLLTLKNSGNAYASVNTQELYPYYTNGTYTGSFWDYPAPNGGTVSRYIYVGTGRYAVISDLYGALFYSPWTWRV